MDVGQDDVVAQGRAVDDIVDAGAERLDPFQPGRALQDVVRPIFEMRAEGNQHLCLGKVGIELADVVDHVHAQRREVCPNVVVVLRAHVRGQGEENEDAGHDPGRRAISSLIAWF